MGKGPGVLLLHGGLQSSRNFMRLGAALADSFTVYIPDRRGRGLSGPFKPGYCMQTEFDDLALLIKTTGARNVFALNSGALIALQAALSSDGISRLALYEPPLAIDGVASPGGWIPRYETALAEGNLAAAFAAILKGTGDRELMTSLPDFILVPMFALGMRLYSAPDTSNEPALKTLIRTMHYDGMLISEMAGRLDRFRQMQIETLLLGGTRSIDYLIAAVNALSAVLPRARRAVLSGAGHLAADDSGKPERVAEELRRFFA